jgi:hypothetical protein
VDKVGQGRHSLSSFGFLQLLGAGSSWHEGVCDSWDVIVWGGDRRSFSGSGGFGVSVDVMGDVEEKDMGTAAGERVGEEEGEVFLKSAPNDELNSKVAHDVVPGGFGESMVAVAGSIDGSVEAPVSAMMRCWGALITNLLLLAMLWAPQRRWRAGT